MTTMIKPAPKSFHGKTLAKSSGKPAAAGAKPMLTGMKKMGEKSTIKSTTKKK